VLPAPPKTRAERWRRWAPRPLAAAVALHVLALALFASWTAFQPVRSVHAGDDALDRLDQGAYEPAASIAQIAVDRNPLSIDPRFELAAIQQARGQTPEALAALEKAVDVMPASAEAWRRLGRFRLGVMSQPRLALNDFKAAYYLDPANPASTSDLIEAARAVKADGG
jgi:tetratricopeptide (TPR) repeat protein